MAQSFGTQPSGHATHRAPHDRERPPPPADAPDRRSHPRRGPRPRSRGGPPAAARAPGLEDERRLARAMSTFEALVAERVPAAAGACRVVGIAGFAIDVE